MAWNVTGVARFAAGELDAARGAHHRARELSIGVVNDPSVLGWARADALLAEVALAEIARVRADEESLRDCVRRALEVLAPLTERDLLGEDVRRATRVLCDRIDPLVAAAETGGEGLRTLARVRERLAK
jgi:hypothetical protein